MQIESGQIVKNLIPSEPVIINKIQKLGSMYSVNYTGVNSKQANTKIIDQQTYINLNVLTKEGTFTFSGDPIKFSLYAEAERISSAYQFDPLFAVNCSIVDPLPHQVEAVYKFLLPQPKIRFLLADDTGAGKTIMTGLLIKELMMRGIIERILIITPGGLTKQWQEDELGLKFNLSFKLVNRASFVAEPTIFSNSDRLITSIDFLRNEDVLNVVKESSWDMIIVDEAHKLTAFDYGQKRYLSKRYQALEILAGQCEHLLLLTATPHRGRKDTFKNLLQLIDKDIFASDSLVTSRVQEIGERGINKFFIRRLKEEMKDWQGNPLFKARHTKTVLYKLTPEEKKLYDRVTDYLLRKRQEATAEANIHVSLALMVMQRRLTSSIYAIMRTLNNRYKALKGLLDQLAKNPNLWQQKQKLDLDMQSLEDFDEFDDEERESLENILSDPRKFKLFTTAKNPGEIREEADHVKSLLDLAKSLYDSNQEEQKYKKLKELLESQGVLKERKEKLVIFTEHKDTLDYLEQRLKNNGYKVVTIHGGKSVDERRSVQIQFARDTQILIATDAAGEGINLQFCRLLINWDIPWNPNRLEQRMGRIHRYGQKQDVLVFNMVAQDTREGNVLERILTKLDLIREQMGDDRVFDVISDVFESVGLDDIINSTMNGVKTNYDTAIESELTEANVEKKIKEQKEKLGYSRVDYKDARELKDHSDEKRLQPIYVRMFFEKALISLGGQFREIRKSIFKIDNLPDIIIQRLKSEYKIQADVSQILFCFDKQVFLEYQNTADLGTVHFINPGNPLFDSLVKIIREVYKEEMLKGTVLVSPVDTDDYLAFLVKSQITDNRPHKERESIADEKLLLVCGNSADNFTVTSPAKLIDLHAPASYAKNVNPPDIVDNQEVTAWAFENLTFPQYNETQIKVKEDAEKRRDYLEESFTNIIIDLTTEINELQAKIFSGDSKVQERITKKQQRITELNQKKKDRLQKLELMQQVDMKPPEILGCAYVVPLNKLEYKNHYGMSRDEDVERIAMEAAIEYELRRGRTPEDVSKENAGYDIRSSNPDLLKRYIEVKGRSADGGVMLSENEMNRLAQLGDTAWLYVVTHCKTKPQLFRVQNPAHNLSFEKKSKGVQYFVHQDEWKGKAENV